MESKVVKTWTKREEGVAIKHFMLRESFADIAKRLGRTETGVRVHLSRMYYAGEGGKNFREYYGARIEKKPLKKYPDTFAQKLRMVFGILFGK